MDGIFVGHHERTGASLFFSERGLLRATRVQRKTADQQWDNEFVRKCRGVAWMLTGGEPEPEVRPPPAPALVMPAPEAIVRAPQQRDRYILKQDVARYGPTPGCEACVALAGGAQRVPQPHSDECRARTDKLVQRDEDTLVQQRLHADRLRRGSTVARSSGDERRNPDAEALGSGLPARSSGDASRVGGAHESTRTGAAAAGSSGGAPRTEGADEPMGTAAEDADVRRGLKRSAELPPDDEALDLVHSRGEHLDEDVPIATPIVKRAEQAADAADAHMSVGKMEMISSAAPKMTTSAAACELNGAEIWILAKTAIELFGASVSRFANKFTSYNIGSSLIIDLTAKCDDGQFWDLQERLEQMQQEHQTELLIGSAPCMAFRTQLHPSEKGTKRRVEEVQDEERRNTQTCIKAYERQLRMGRHFMHEHPEHASSWSMSEM